VFLAAPPLPGDDLLTVGGTEREAMPNNSRSGLGELLGAFVLCVASLAFVLWIVAVAGGSRTLFAATSSDQAAADIAERTRAQP
jgi:hypothetical protein